MANQSSLDKHDLNILKGCEGIVGVDEAGRGALAGPVYAAAVYLQPAFFKTDWFKANGFIVNDSKQLGREQRAKIVDELKSLSIEGWEGYAESASVAEIDELNILRANTLAMNRAIKQLSVSDNLLSALGNENSSPNIRLLVDGRPVVGLGFQHDAIVKGDGKSFAIALASILAKESRDREMEKLGKKFPQYGIENHMGYGTQFHRAKILEFGPSPIHRPLFLRKILGQGQLELGVDF